MEHEYCKWTSNWMSVIASASISGLIADSFTLIPCLFLKFKRCMAWKPAHPRTKMKTRQRTRVWWLCNPRKHYSENHQIEKRAWEITKPYCILNSWKWATRRNENGRTSKRHKTKHHLLCCCFIHTFCGFSHVQGSGRAKISKTHSFRNSHTSQNFYRQMLWAIHISSLWHFCCPEWLPEWSEMPGGNWPPVDAAFGNSRRLRWRFHWASASASVHRSFPSNQALHFGDTQGYHVASSRYVSHDIMSYIVIYCDNVQIWAVKVDGIHVSDGFETVRRVLDDAKPQFQAKSWGPASGWIAMDHLRFDPWTTSARGGHGQTDIVIRYYHDKSW